MNNAIIEIAMGVVLMYLTLSLVCTTINEWISSITKQRASTLAQGIKDLIDDPNVHAAFYNHGLISGACAATNNKPSYFSAKSVATALLESLDPKTQVMLMSDAQTAAQALPDSNIRDVILSAIATSNNDLQTLRDNIAVWFDDSMDRVSGLYKRWARIVAFWIGMVVAVALNADTIAVTNALWANEPLRAAIAKQAEAATSLDDLKKLTVEQQNASLGQLPIGWTEVPHLPHSKADLWAGLVKLLGWIITGLALSLGAPFWFDVLNKFINIRASGTKPEAANKK